MTRPGCLRLSAMVVLALTAGACGQGAHVGSPTRASLTTSTAPSPTVTTLPPTKAEPSDPISSEAAAVVQAGKVAARFQLPPGAVLQSTPVPPPLLHVRESIGALNGDVTRWWTVPGKASAVEQWVLHHPAAGLEGGPLGPPIHGESMEEFSVAPGVEAPVTHIDVSFAQVGDHTDVRIHVQVVWTPARTAIEHIPATVRSAVITFRPERNSPTEHVATRTARLTGAGLHRMVAVLNTQLASSAIGGHCPLPASYEAAVKLTFSYGGHRVVLRVAPCQGIDVTADGKEQPALAGSDLVMATAKAVFPANVDTTATTAWLDYIPPTGGSGRPAEKSVTGPTYQRLAADLADLRPLPAGTVTCNVVSGESASITVTTIHHTKVYVVDGSLCRGVRLTIDDQPAQLLAGSITLLRQVRAIAGTSGLAHPMPRRGVSSP